MEGGDGAFTVESSMELLDGENTEFPLRITLRPVELELELTIGDEELYMPLKVHPRTGLESKALDKQLTAIEQANYKQAVEEYTSIYQHLKKAALANAVEQMQRERKELRTSHRQGGNNRELQEKKQQKLGTAPIRLLPMNSEEREQWAEWCQTRGDERERAVLDGE